MFLFEILFVFFASTGSSAPKHPVYHSQTRSNRRLFRVLLLSTNFLSHFNQRLFTLSISKNNHRKPFISPFDQRPIPSHLQTCAWAREPATAAAAQLAAMRLSNDRPARRTAASGQAARIGV